MESLLLSLVAMAAFSELGIALLSDGTCMPESCIVTIERASRNILRVEWKPISVFPEEAKRFTSTAKKQRSAVRSR